MDFPLSVICRRCGWGQGWFPDFCLPKRYLAVFLCIATSPQFLQTRLSLKGFLTPMLDFPPLCSCDWRDIAPAYQYKLLSLRKCIFAVAFWDVPESMSHLPSLSHITCHTFISTLYCQHRFCLISSLFDLSPELLYFGVLYFLFSLRFAEKGVLWGFSLSLCCCVLPRKIYVYNFTVFIPENATKDFYSTMY